MLINHGYTDWLTLNTHLSLGEGEGGDTCTHAWFTQGTDTIKMYTGIKQYFNVTHIFIKILDVPYNMKILQIRLLNFSVDSNSHVSSAP